MTNDVFHSASSAPLISSSGSSASSAPLISSSGSADTVVDIATPRATITLTTPRHTQRGHSLRIVTIQLAPEDFDPLIEHAETNRIARNLALASGVCMGLSLAFASAMLMTHVSALGTLAAVLIVPSLGFAFAGISINSHYITKAKISKELKQAFRDRDDPNVKAFLANPDNATLILNCKALYLHEKRSKLDQKSLQNLRAAIQIQSDAEVALAKRAALVQLLKDLESSNFLLRNVKPREGQQNIEIERVYSLFYDYLRNVNREDRF